MAHGDLDLIHSKLLPNAIAFASGEWNECKVVLARVKKSLRAKFFRICPDSGIVVHTKDVCDKCRSCGELDSVECQGAIECAEKPLNRWRDPHELVDAGSEVGEVSKVRILNLPVPKQRINLLPALLLSIRVVRKVVDQPRNRTRRSVVPCKKEGVH